MESERLPSYTLEARPKKSETGPIQFVEASSLDSNLAFNK